MTSMIEVQEIDSFQYNRELLSIKFYNKSAHYKETFDLLFESFKDTAYLFASPNERVRHEWNKRYQRILLTLPWNQRNVSRFLLINPKKQFIAHAVVGIMKSKKDKNILIDSYFSLILWFIKTLPTLLIFLPFNFGFYSFAKLFYMPSKYWIPYNKKQNQFLKNNNLSKVFIKQFCISPQFQRKGYGTMFMKWILNKYISNKYPSSPVIIQCISTNARSFYLHQIGFKEFAVFKIKTKYNEIAIGDRLIWYQNEQKLNEWMDQLQADNLFGKIKKEPDIVHNVDIINHFNIKNKTFWCLFAAISSLAILFYKYFRT